MKKRIENIFKPRIWQELKWYNTWLIIHILPVKIFCEGKKMNSSLKPDARP
jgi:hypothetical protein